jgi:hypothetical protein
MPVYRFQGPVGADPEPIELANDDAAWSEAVTLFGAMLRDADGALPSGSEWRLLVFDGNNEEVIRIESRAQRRGRAPER